MKTWLLVDGNYMSYRARHTTGSLSFNEQRTGVAFGVLRSLEEMCDTFQPQIVILAFDSSHNLRKIDYPQYKANRRQDMTPDEEEDFKLFCQEVVRLKGTLLPMAGYRNIIEVRGYEADDIIAQYAQDLPQGDKAIIVSSDGDLLQCLRDGVEAYNPTSRKITTAADFKDKWGIDTLQWAHVKALAGCETDNIEGIEGVKEKSVVGFFNGKLKPSKDPENKPGRYEKIEANLHLIKRNLPLVKLPYPGLRVPKPQPDQVTAENKRRVEDELGIRPARTSDRAKEARKRKMQQMDQGIGFDLGELK